MRASSPAGHLVTANAIIESVNAFCAFVLVGAVHLEILRRERYDNMTVAQQQRDTARALAANFLPAPVLAIMQGQGKGKGNDEALAWSFPAVFMLHSDIVG